MVWELSHFVWCIESYVQKIVEVQFIEFKRNKAKKDKKIALDFQLQSLFSADTA